MYSEIFKGYYQKPEDILTTFDADNFSFSLKNCEGFSAWSPAIATA